MNTNSSSGREGGSEKVSEPKKEPKFQLMLVPVLSRHRLLSLDELMDDLSGIGKENTVVNVELVF